MKKRKTFLSGEKAASPVIGVMLMVVVTVILAAAVSSYSGGMISGTKTAPNAAFEVQIKKGVDIDSKNVSFMKIKEITGDSIDTKDLKITTSYTDNDGDFHLTEVMPGEVNTETSIEGNSINSVSPYWNNPAKGKFGQDEEVDFGNFVLKPGIVMIAESNEDDVADTSKTGMDAIISDWYKVTKGDFITISIVHTASNKVIFESEVEVV